MERSTEPSSSLSGELLARVRERAAGYDERNEFFADDLDELRRAGYLAPRGLERASTDQRLLAAHAPATALGLTMHLVWMGVARDLAAAGDDTLAWVLDDIDAGEVFAFALSEAGNDAVMTNSTTRVDRVDGGWAFTGTKIMTTLSPAWTRLGVLGRYEAAAGEPQIVHGFLTRDTADIEIVPDWNALGMRATQSFTTKLNGAVVPDERVSRVLPVGPQRDRFLLAISANFHTLIASVYAGIADRALELAVASAHRRTRLSADGAPYAHDPDTRRMLAAAALDLDALAPQLTAVARDVDGGVDRADRWQRDLAGLKHRAVETARRVVDTAMRASGGGAYRADGELARLQRDVLAGVYHPSDTEAVHASVAAHLLGPLP